MGAGGRVWALGGWSVAVLGYVCMGVGCQGSGNLAWPAAHGARRATRLLRFQNRQSGIEYRSAARREPTGVLYDILRAGQRAPLAIPEHSWWPTSPSRPVLCALPLPPTSNHAIIPTHPDKGGPGMPTEPPLPTRRPGPGAAGSHFPLASTSRGEGARDRRTRLVATAAQDNRRTIAQEGSMA